MLTRKSCSISHSPVTSSWRVLSLSVPTTTRIRIKSNCIDNYPCSVMDMVENVLMKMVSLYLQVQKSAKDDVRRHRIESRPGNWAHTRSKWAIRIPDKVSFHNWWTVWTVVYCLFWLSLLQNRSIRLGAPSHAAFPIELRNRQYTHLLHWAERWIFRGSLSRCHHMQLWIACECLWSQDQCVRFGQSQCVIKWPFKSDIFALLCKT